MKISLYLLSLLEMFLWVLKLESFSVDYLKLMTQQQQKFFECQHCVLDYFRHWELEMWIRYRLWPETVKTHGKQYQSVQFSSVTQPCPIFAIPWITACQASLSITNSWGLLKLMAIESVRPSSHLILCRPLLLLPPVPSSIRVFSNESTLRIRWPKFCSFSFSISPSNEHPGQQYTEIQIYQWELIIGFGE